MVVRRTAGKGGRSKFLAYAFVALLACFAVMLASVLVCLGMLGRLGDRMQDVLVSSLDRQIDAVEANTGFSGTRYNISDSLLNNEALAALGQDGALAEDGAAEQAAPVLEKITAQTGAVLAERYLYFSNADYLMDAARGTADVRGEAPAPVAAMLDELGGVQYRIVGSYENHVGQTGPGSVYQLMVRTVAPDVYYVVYFPDYGGEVPESFADFGDVQMYYYDQFGGCAACQERDGLAAAYSYDTLGEADTGTVYARQDGVAYIGVYCTSHPRNIRLAIFFVDEVAAMRELALAVAAVAGVVLVATCAATVASVRRLYRPVSSLADRIEGAATAGAGGRGRGQGQAGTPRLRDDGSVIAGALEAYESQVERQRDLLGASWLRRLLLNDSPEVLGGYEDEWVTALDGTPFTVAVVRADAPQPHVRLDELVERGLGGGFDLKAVSIMDTAAAVVRLGGRPEGELIDALKALQASRPELELSAFTGTPRASVDQLGACYAEAAAAADRCLSQEVYGVVLRCGDVRLEDRGARGDFELMRVLARMSGRIRATDATGALIAFDEAAALIEGADGEGDGGPRGPRGSAAYLGLVRSCMLVALEGDGTAGGGAGAGEGDTGEGGAGGEDGAGGGSDLAAIEEAGSLAQLRRGLAAAMRRLSSAQERRESRKLFEAMEQALLAGYRDPSISAGSLARATGVSQSQVTKLFRKYNATTFLERLHGLRLAEAETLLRTTSLSEGEIAARVGYNNTVSMIRAFKKYRGVVPSSLRKGGGAPGA